MKFLWLSVVPVVALAAAEPIPDLQPPRGELRPGFWEQHAWMVAAGALLLLAMLAIWLWWLRRPKPAISILPEAQARSALETLRGRPEDDALVTEVSHILRHYVLAAFNLPPEELTTAELRRSLEARTNPRLHAALFGFLCRCDERKFAPAHLTHPMDSVPAALELIEKIETDLKQPARNAVGAAC